MSGKSDSDIADSLASGGNPSATYGGAGDTSAGGGKLPLGIRSNNPLNILDRDKNERVYETPEAGIRAAAENLRRGYRGLSLAAIADKWTGGARTGNTPQQMANYVGLLSKGTGLSADQVPDLNNQAVVASLLAAQIRAENGQQPYSPDQINAGVAAALSGKQGGGLSLPPPPGGQDAMHASRLAEMQQQATKLHITFDNVPAGVRPEAKTQDGSYLPTRVNYRLDGI
jgi:hypothetical protein